jgi:hypothetical protein
MGAALLDLGWASVIESTCSPHRLEIHMTYDQLLPHLE